MTPKRSLFFDEWQACLRAHYVHVIRTQDAVTEPTLRHVLLHSGLSDDELADLREHVQREFNVAPLGEPFEAAPQDAIPPTDDELPPPDLLADEDAEADDDLPDEAQNTYDELVGAAPTEPSPDDDAETIAEPPPEDAADIPYDERDEDDALDDGYDQADEPPYQPPASQLSLF